MVALLIIRLNFKKGSNLGIMVKLESIFVIGKSL